MLVTLLPIVTEVKPLQLKKVFSPILVTLLGIVTEVKPEQSLKAHSPMLVTLLGIVTEVKPEQPRKALLPMLVTLLGITVVLHPFISVFDAVSIKGKFNMDATPEKLDELLCEYSYLLWND